MLTFPTTHKGVGRASPSRSEYEYSRSYSGALMLYTSGMLARMSKIAVASSSYEHRVCDKHYQKNLRRRLRLERVADGRLVIPRWVRIVCVLLLYCDVVCIEVCFGAVHTSDQYVHNG